jgi:hypothetical protein
MYRDMCNTHRIKALRSQGFPWSRKLALEGYRDKRCCAPCDDEGAEPNHEPAMPPLHGHDVVEKDENR